MRHTELQVNDLMRAVQGDLDAFDAVAEQPHAAIQRVRSALPELLVTAASVRRVLRRLQSHDVSPARVQQWASFVRRGYLGGSTTGPVSPIDIEYEASCEQQIADTIARLDEIGDPVDGAVGVDEIAAMIASLAPSRS